MAEVLSRSDAMKLDKVRIVGEGLNKIIEAREAWMMAEKKGLDLALVSLEAQPPVVRIQDLKKIEYEKKKARKKSRQTSVLKEVHLKVNISNHDLATKTAQIQKFIDRGDKVKVSVRLKGREREMPERAQELLDKLGLNLKAQMSVLSGPNKAALFEPEKNK